MAGIRSSPRCKGPTELRDAVVEIRTPLIPRGRRKDTVVEGRCGKRRLTSNPAKDVARTMIGTSEASAIIIRGHSLFLCFRFGDGRLS